MNTGPMEALWRSSQLEGDNAAYLEHLYELYLDDPQSVAPKWRNYFEGLMPDKGSEVKHSHIRQQFLDLAQAPLTRMTPMAGPAVDALKLNQVMDLVSAFRQRGHYEAQLDPLKLTKIIKQRALDPATYGLSEADLNRSWPIPGFEQKPLKEVIQNLRQIYCSSLGFEYWYLENLEAREWLRQRIEAPRPVLSPEKKKWLLERLIAADGLEKYLGMRYVGQKRFSLEGGDSLIPLLDTLIHKACDDGAKEIVIGMAHRGRLNVLVNIMGKAPKDLFAEFEGKHSDNLLAGDVKYHKGFSSDIKTEGGVLHFALLYNPSHLEIVSPVAEGSVRARQERRGNNRDQVLAIHMHGDAAIVGQGCVYEMLNMAQTRGYGNGGSIHIVVNNQVGFTTSQPEDMRSMYYCTDVAKTFSTPVIHVNAEDPEAVLFAAALALDFRHEFFHDIFIDLVCYRRHGHNEADEPSATQPVMYQVIKALPPTWKNYANGLKAAGIVNDQAMNLMQQQYKQALEAGNPVKELVPAETNKKFISDWTPYLDKSWQEPYESTLPLEKIKALGAQLDLVPSHFTIQPQVAKMLQERMKMSSGEMPINWGYAEIMAYATLVDQKIHVRLSGEDSGRGTFAHRHAVLHDQKTGETYIPLNHLSSEQAFFTVIDSVLSEEAVLGFEYGYAGSTPDDLVIWEAQFGDFVNGAQVIIDQFISSAEEKWGRLSGLTLLLPHGQEGMGPEHSSARLERFLQLCAHDNMQVCAPTTPAQIYHLLRRQILRPYRKPLIVMSPKSLLRHPLVVSNLEDLANGHFYNVLPEGDSLKTVKRVVLCQGKVYYDLLAKRREQKIEDIALIRIEQLYPFPQEELKQVLSTYSSVKDWVWCQEEPHNQGAWFKVEPDIQALLPKNCNLRYVGRKDYASPAVGYPSLFSEEQHALVAEALKN